jgi:hypothetical protein
MCECGCVLTDDRYVFPGPGKSIYLLTLSAECVNCDAPPGVTIERVEPGTRLYEDYRRGVFDGSVEFEDWPESKGVAIIAGMRRREFVNAVKGHLVGLAVKDFTMRGTIDEDGAEVILEDMYEDAQVRPRFPEPAADKA